MSKSPGETGSGKDIEDRANATIDRRSFLASGAAVGAVARWFLTVMNLRSVFCLWQQMRYCAAFFYSKGTKQITAKYTLSLLLRVLTTGCYSNRVNWLALSVQFFPFRGVTPIAWLPRMSRSNRVARAGRAAASRKPVTGSCSAGR